MRIRKLRDGLLAHGFRFAVVAGINAVLIVLFVLADQFVRHQGGDFGGKRVVSMAFFQVIQCGKVLQVVTQNGIDKFQTFEIIIYQCVQITVPKIIRQQLLIDFQAAEQRFVGMAQIRLHKCFGGQPPRGDGIFLPFFQVIRTGLAFIVVRHAVEQKLIQ